MHDRPLASPRLLAPVMFALAMLPSLAIASGGGGGEGASMYQNILLILAVIGVAYLISHLLLDRIQRRFGIVTGVEYIVLGAVVGPAFGLLDHASLEQFTPAVVLGTGSLGLITGIRLDLRHSDTVEPEPIRISLWITLLTALTVVALPIAVISFYTSADTMQTWLPAILCAGAVSLVADPGPLQSLQKFLSARGDSTFAAIKVARLCASLAVIAFGTVFCMYDHDAVFLPQSLATLDWFLIHLVLGAVLGIIFGSFLRRGFEDEKLLTVVIGTVVFTSGIAYYLRLSPIFVNFILGFVLINTCRTADQVALRLDSIERPLYIALFFFAGASMNLSAPWWSYLLVVPYILLRTTGRLAGGLIAMRTSPVEPRLPALGRVLFAPGALSVAMLLDFQQVYGGTKPATVAYSGLVVAVIFSEIFSYIRTRSWLIDYTDVPPAEIRQVLSGQSQQPEVA